MHSHAERGNEKLLVNILVPALCVGTDESASKDKRHAFPRGAWERE